MIFYLRGDTMLLQFRVKNVKSFRDEAILDFTAAGITEHENHVREKNGNKLLPLVAIYGANASGKTNIVSALNDMCEFIRTSIDSSESRNNYRFVFMPFIYNPDTYKEPCEFEVTVSLDKTYRYGFTIDNESLILSEYLEFQKTVNGKFFTVYERKNHSKFKIGTSKWLSEIEKDEMRYISSYIGENELILTVLGRRQKSSSTGALSRYSKLYEWFSRAAQCPECLNWDFDIIEVRENTPISSMFTRGSASKEYINFVRKADPTITGMRLENDNEEEPKKEVGRQLLTYRYIKECEQGVELPTILESSGTMYIMRTYPVIKQVLENGGLLVADEIDRSLHPILLLDVINLFTNPETNPNNAQLLCTMHNVVIMDRRFLRRDEIWFVERNENGESSLYSLADFEVGDKAVRKDADFCKNYILGRYGAVPEQQ